MVKHLGGQLDAQQLDTQIRLNLEISHFVSFTAFSKGHWNTTESCICAINLNFHLTGQIC